MLPKDGYEKQIQFALEQGIGGVVSTLARNRYQTPVELEMVHCSRLLCRLAWEWYPATLKIFIYLHFLNGKWISRSNFRHEQLVCNKVFHSIWRNFNCFWVWKELMKCCLINSQEFVWEDIILWENQWMWKSLRVVVCKQAPGAAV